MTTNKSLPVFFPGLRQVQFRKRLLSWYDAHARALPWRNDRNPYRVWISEIMLQQTRVAAVLDHYHEFLLRFPSVQKLAAARGESVLAAWSGLGYYRRARMMHATAKRIVREYGGNFPATAEELGELPGIGRYTAAAIASIAFGVRVAVVDGNVERVLQRLAGRRLAGEEFWRAANELADAKRPGDFNQAMMELGAVICTPRSPGCGTCPVRALCVTRGELPILNMPAQKKKQKIHYVMDVRESPRGSEVFLVRRRHDTSLMPRMWELPELVGIKPAGDAALTLRHSITVTDYTVEVWAGCGTPDGVDGKWIRLERVGRVATTGLTRKILQKAELL